MSCAGKGEPGLLDSTGRQLSPCSRLFYTSSDRLACSLTPSLIFARKFLSPEPPDAKREAGCSPGSEQGKDKGH